MIATVAQIMAQSCPECGALPKQPCMRYSVARDERELYNQWHLGRRHEAEKIIAQENPEGASDLLPPLVFFYCAVQISRNLTGVSGTPSTAHTITQHRVLARSIEEAMGLAFQQSQRLKPEYNVGNILVMPHRDDGVTLAETTKPGPQ